MSDPTEDEDGPSVRAMLQATLEPMVPSDWQFIPNQRMPQTIDRVTVVLKHGKITPLPEAPTSHLTHDIVLTVVDPHEDQVTAEDALDQHVVELIAAIQAAPDHIGFEQAEKVMVTSTYLGWDLTIQFITQKKASQS